MKIIIDTIGSDLGPEIIVKGAMDAAKRFGVELLLVGDSKHIQSILDNDKWDYEPEIIEAPDAIKNEDSPTLAIRRKKESSMVKSLEILRDGMGDGVLSVGSTGALLAGGMFIVKRIDGVKRAALTCIYPTTKHMAVLVDAGANVEVTPQILVQFAIMASVYVKNAYGLVDPKIALVNVGVEEGKGTELIKQTYRELKRAPINFIGNIEARDIPFGKCDIILCDGFTGNVILKLTEGMAYSMVHRFKDAIHGSFRSKIGALLLKPSLLKVKQNLDYREYGGVPLLGLTKPVFKAHGSSDAFAIENAIGRMKDFIDQNVIEQVENQLKGVDHERTNIEDNF